MRFQLLEDIKATVEDMPLNKGRSINLDFLYSKQQTPKGLKKCLLSLKQKSSYRNTTRKLP